MAQKKITSEQILSLDGLSVDGAQIVNPNSIDIKEVRGIIKSKTSGSPPESSQIWMTSSAGEETRRITNNDGGGNWNFRIGHYFDNGSPFGGRYLTTGSGAAQLQLTADGQNGHIALNVAPTGTVGGLIGSWANSLSVTTTATTSTQRISAQDGLTSSTQIRVPDGSVGTPSYSFTSRQTTGLFSNSSNQVRSTHFGSLGVILDSLNSYSGNWNSRTNGAYDLGLQFINEWRDLYIVNAPTVSSDLNLKTAITDTTLGLNFIEELRPVEYKLKECNDVVISGSPPGPTVVPRAGVRKHHGLIAQEVKTALDTLGVSTTDFAGYVESDGSPSRHSLRYEEFIAPLIKAAQELKAENDALSASVAALTARVDALEA